MDMSNGTKLWYVATANGINQVALQYKNGDIFWYRNGKLHRENGPAIEFANGDKHWYINGKLHREDGPAIEDAINGIEKWYKNGELYRENGHMQKL